MRSLVIRYAAARLLSTNGLVGFAIAALAVAGCANVNSEPLTLRIQYAATSQFVPLIPLAPKELYRHYGKSYVVDPKFMIGAGPALTALMASELELAALNPQSMANAVVTAKLDLRAIVQVLATDMPGYSGGQYWCRDPIKRAEDMRGKTIAINSRGSSPEAAARAYLARFGMKDGDYQFVEMPFSASLPALDSKRVDCAVMVAPWQHEMPGRPGFTKVFTLADVLGPSESVVWTGKPEWIAKNRATLVDFVEDHISFRRWALDPKTQPEAAKLAAQIDKQPVEKEAWIFTEKDNWHHPEGWINTERFQKNVSDLHTLGVTPGVIDAAKYIDNSIQQEALARFKTN